MEAPDTPVKAKAVLVDPAAMTVLWLNEAAAEDLSGTAPADAIGAPLETVLPMPAELGVPAALGDVAESGDPRHLRVELVSMARGSITVSVSIYRLPGGELLLLSEHAWQPAPRSDTSAGGRRRRPSL